jgi:hypothetical protein
MFFKNLIGIKGWSLPDKRKQVIEIKRSLKNHFTTDTTFYYLPLISPGNGIGKTLNLIGLTLPLDHLTTSAPLCEGGWGVQKKDLTCLKNNKNTARNKK